MAFKWEGSWRKRGTYLGGNKEVSDAEVYDICQALETLNDRNEEDVRYTVFTDSQAALSRVQHDRTGPGQAMAIRAITTAKTMTERGNTITLRWTLPMQASREMSRQMRRLERQQRKEKRGLTLHASRRQACHTPPG